MDAIEKLLYDSLTNNIKGLVEKKRNVVAYLYLSVAVQENISIAEAFKKYYWLEVPSDDTKAKYEEKSGNLLVKEARFHGFTICLIPRSGASVCSLPYRQAAFELVDVIKGALHI